MSVCQSANVCCLSAANPSVCLFVCMSVFLFIVPSELLHGGNACVFVCLFVFRTTVSPFVCAFDCTEVVLKEGRGLDGLRLMGIERKIF